MKTMSVREPNQLKIDKGFLTIVGQSKDQTYEIGSFITIGRDPTCAIVVDDPFLSLRHARIETQADGFYIRDLKSRNGTLVNGTRVIEARLSSNDRVKLGQTELIFTMEKLSEITPAFTKSLNREWNEQLQRIPAIAQSSHPVLLLGASGTGKEVIASLLHKLSLRSRGPLLSVNCSALTDSLAESELFGHVKGSFSGASSDRKGAFEAARGGTLFLDEVGDLPLSQQPKLLRALENREIRPIGMDETVHIDVRIIAATNKDLRDAVKAGKFREDLYFRLHVLQLKLPSLQERVEDFDALLKHFSEPLQVRFTLNALIRLRSYPWPGNIRELKNLVLRASALFPDKAIDDKELDVLLDKPVKQERKSSDPIAVGSIIRQFERDLIIETLTANHGNQRRTARQLGMAKSTLHDRVKSFAIDVNAFKNP